MAVYPDYDHSVLSVASSILKHYGASCDHASLPLLDGLLGKSRQNVVLLLFDGMGISTLQEHLPKDSFLRRNQRAEISSVFPSTTTAATVSVETGLSPIEHGWLGWSLYFAELDANVNLFPNTLSGTNGLPAADYNVATRYLPFRTVYEKIEAATGGLIQTCRVSPFSEYRIQSSGELCGAVASRCLEAGRKYIYAYWYQPDEHMHDYGVGHEIIRQDLERINSEVEAMCAGLHDTLVIVTADHGAAETDWLYIADHPEIEACLERIPSIEARAISFFVKEGFKRRFEELFNRAFGDSYDLMTRETVLQKGLFGSGAPHPRSLGFIGDYIAVAIGNTSLEYNPSKKGNLFKAAHAGMTRDEMRVPLILVEC